MILGGLRCEDEDGSGRAVLRAELRFAPRSGRAPFEIWSAVPAAYGADLDRTATPFVPLATLVATHLGERLIVDAPASERIIANCSRAAELFADWWYEAPAAIHAEEPVAVPAARGDGVALLFSRGVDTGATLVRSRTGRIPERVTHLLSGFDIEWVFSTEVQHQIWADNEIAAAEYGLPLIKLENNSRELLRGMIGWPRCFGVAYMASALALGPRFATILTGSSTQSPTRPTPSGCRYDLDPLWSTEATGVRQDGYELSRSERIELVASDPTTLRHLRVCWFGRGARNCGRCGKCLRTMTGLKLAGAPEGVAHFDGELTLEAVRNCKIERESAATWSIAESLPPEMSDYAEAWRHQARDADRRAAAEHRQADRRARARERRRRLRRMRRSLSRTLRRRASDPGRP